MTMDQAMALLRSCFDPFTGCLPTPWELEEDFRQNRLLTAGDQGILRFSGGRTAELRHLAVAQASRGRGIGRDLVARFNVCTAGRRALVWTGADNTAALHLYETAGFRPDGWSSLVLIQA